MQNLINVKCLNSNCNNRFDIYKSSYDKKKKLYCCRKCRSEHHWLITPLYEKPCLNCGNIMKRKFLQKLERLKYCCEKCRKEHKNYIKTNSTIKSNCSVCKKELINKREPCGKLVPRKTCDECIDKINKKTALNMCNVVNNRYKNDPIFRKKRKKIFKETGIKMREHHKIYGLSQKWIDAQKTRLGKGTGKSKLEDKLNNYLNSKITNTEIRRYEPISNMMVDFYIPNKNLVIECHGDYWHMNPSKYSSNDYNTLTKRTAKEQWNKDLRRRLFMESRGYKVVEVWESEINNGDYKKLDIYV